ncbi:probable membrane-associated kinase regulator 1 [Hevea brasiliensis]|uniref:probable membrane-associated kinase regulator 1 n=1 Tax=Hevea brasiliensis TaxID=3981 RepID=UPI0025DA9334|nr:probable membrane-associated kinase regulator 1 [Hevea brasiliensis]
MEHHHQKTSCRDIFSFPSTPSQVQDSDFHFEFGCFTPVSPSTDPCKTSPADHLFYNGRLLPNSFPVLQQQQTPTTAMVFVGSISRASSRNCISSKDSLITSRSNSVNSSRSSVSSSARTSWSSDNSERRLLYHSTKLASRTPGTAIWIIPTVATYQACAGHET